MYSDEIISTLTERIGFGTPQEESFAVQISEANSTGASSRIFKSFHALCTIENIFDCIDIVLPDHADSSDKFNAILDDFRNGAVREILPAILNSHVDYIIDTDYSKTIEDNIVLFDNAIGFKVAMSVLEMFASSKRINITERNSKLSSSNLKLELNGFRNENGALVARGLVHEYQNAVKAARNKIFPILPIVEDGNAW